ncbi:MAG: nucleotide disphospho-sugar-binding domain-containing protein [Cyanobacteria bacterium J06648_10]
MSRIVLTTWGSLGDLHPMLALGVLLGDNPPPKGLPSSIFACDYAPYSQLFPHACAIIHQGRIGTTAQALRAGCPTLVMPYSLDQPDNAARVQRLGTSRMLTRKQCSASRLTEELKILLEGSCYIEKAAEVGHNMQSENGARVACDAIEKQLEKELVKV